MKIKAKINGNIVYIVQIFFDDLRSCVLCAYVNGVDLLFGYPKEFKIIGLEE